MTEAEREQIAGVWRDNRDALLGSFTPERLSLVAAYYPPLRWTELNNDVSAMQRSRIFRFDFHQCRHGVLVVWYVTCEGELVEYGV